MAYRNWKQELEDRRPAPGRGHPGLWAGAAAALIAVVCCALWLWPGFLRSKEQAAPPTAEDMYIQETEPNAR